MAMLTSEIQLYLSDALDQEACKKTLTEALQSRVRALQAMDIPDATIITCLEDLAEDTYQLNDDVILDVIEWILIAAMFS